MFSVSRCLLSVSLDQGRMGWAKRSLNPRWILTRWLDPEILRKVMQIIYIAATSMLLHERELLILRLLLMLLVLLVLIVFVLRLQWVVLLHCVVRAASLLRFRWLRCLLFQWGQDLILSLIEILEFDCSTLGWGMKHVFLLLKSEFRVKGVTIKTYIIFITTFQCLLLQHCRWQCLIFIFVRWNSWYIILDKLSQILLFLLLQLLHFWDYIDTLE